MKVTHLHEPELEFGNQGSHIDIRFGIMAHGPFDYGTSTAPSELRVGIVGTAETAEGVREWIERARLGVEGKDTRLRSLFPPFPGFSSSSCFGASVVLHDKWCGTLSKRELEGLGASGDSATMVEEAVELFLAYGSDLAEPGGPQVLICAPPAELLAALESSRRPEGDALEEEIDEGAEAAKTRSHTYSVNFHDVLKARGMRLGIPIQMVRPATYGGGGGRRGAKRSMHPLQDEATRAWNFHVALYYKAGGIPWRLIRDAADLTACFVGVSFYRDLSGERLLTSVAQVFNERGEGIIVKGGTAQLDKIDRQPHLSSGDAELLLTEALKVYRREHKTLPARLVLHKTSPLTHQEAEGFTSAAARERIEILDLVSVRRSFTRLFREGNYPPLRGTFLELDTNVGLLYLRGSVEFFKSYPGLYVPRPLEFHSGPTGTTLHTLARELMALSKLNWNNTQFDGGEPISVRAARRVGDILKCVPEEQSVRPSFRFFM